MRWSWTPPGNGATALYKARLSSRMPPHGLASSRRPGKATGVRVMDQHTREITEYRARVIFLCASAIASAGILLQSQSARFPNGLGNDSGELGHNIMDHHLGVGARSRVEGYEDRYYKGRRANGIYIPRFRNLGGESDMSNFIRGYGYQGSASREGWSRAVAEMQVGGNLKDQLMEPGQWTMGIGGFGEILPQHRNFMELDHDNLDQWGFPWFIAKLFHLMGLSYIFIKQNGIICALESFAFTFQMVFLWA